MGKITTDASAKAAKPTEKSQAEYPDAKIGGLALRVTPAGKKTWTFRYRTGEGLQRRLSIGGYPSVTLTAARQAAIDALGAVAKGKDPASEKRKARVAAKARKLSTISTLLDAYFEDAAKGRHRKEARPKRETTLTMEKDYADRLIRPRFGALPLDELDRHSLQTFLDKVGEKTRAGARHCRNIIRQAYNYAIRRDLVGKNPAQLAELPRPSSRERVLSDDELRKVWALASEPGSVKGLHLAPRTGIALCLAIVTLQRGGEVCGIHADEIDREQRVWVLPSHRTKNHREHIVPLSKLALDLLGEAFGSDEWQGFAFPSPKGKGAITRRALSRAAKRLTTAAKINDVTPHDFRRTGATFLTGERIGIPRFIVSRVLNQISDTGGAAAATGVYDRNEYLVEKRRGFDAWAALLREIVSGVARPTNVISLLLAGSG